MKLKLSPADWAIVDPFDPPLGRKHIPATVSGRLMSLADRRGVYADTAYFIRSSTSGRVKQADCKPPFGYLVGEKRDDGKKKSPSSSYPRMKQPRKEEVVRAEEVWLWPVCNTRLDTIAPLKELAVKYGFIPSQAWIDKDGYIRGFKKR